MRFQGNAEVLCVGCSLAPLQPLLLAPTLSASSGLQAKSCPREHLPNASPPSEGATTHWDVGKSLGTFAYTCKALRQK